MLGLRGCDTRGCDPGGNDLRLSPLSGYRSALPRLDVLNGLARWQGGGEPQLSPALDMVSLFAHARGALRRKCACACWSHSKHIPTEE